VVGLLYVPAALALVPAAAITMAAGLVFGPTLAFLVAVPAGTISACAAFRVGRVLAGDPDLLVQGEGRIARLARRLGDGRRGFWTVLLLRLSPVTPFAFLNFAFGGTPISLSAFALATLLGSIPTSALFAFGPSALGLDGLLGRLLETLR
jgi:uncharacterized membrane protein YdjX (TVP38/TMEM64 family)